ncbi:MAG TPA: 2-oxoacid ferredoxin oxidoreductase, partial [Candidatus Latescibacteria bacterium]|nr:2-oxoacid ferredoxin oxidoreductase [Candidatus Latescibacterota bacterium]
YNSFRDLQEKPGGAIGCSSIRAIEAYDTGVLYIPTMGAGGAIYSGWSQFNDHQHIYQYLGDGSYFHSGRGAIQSCIHGQVNITFLLLYNGAVALTGGQQPGGQRPVPDVVQELLGLGVVQVGVVCEDPARYRSLASERIEIYALEDHAKALADFKRVRGTTVLILDKECATEKGRRRRQQGLTPDEYVLIDEAICEGCGDCYAQSEGCAALYSVETEFGDKTQVRQASCAQDGLCIDGECPSFAIIKPAKGTRLKKRRPEALQALPEPPACAIDGTYSIFAMGRGGTGVVTISHLIAYAAMMDGKYVYLSNNTGLAQKGGPVEAPILISETEQPVFNRLFPGGVDLYLGFDLLRSAEPDNLKYASSERTRAMVSTAEIANASMNRNPRQQAFPEAAGLQALIEQYTKKDNIYLDTYCLAEELFADTLYANMILLGAAYQAGAVPLSGESLERAIELNARAVENNIQAFRWGRLSVVDPGRVERALGTKKVSAQQALNDVKVRLTTTAKGAALLDEALAVVAGLDAEGQRELCTRLAELCDYQDEAYARRYLSWIQKVWQVEQGLPTRDVKLTRAVVRGLFKIMAYKDEYEVARLATATDSEQRMRALFDGEVEIVRQLHPPTLRGILRKKIGFARGLRPSLVLLSRLKSLRATVFDIFARTPARKMERELVDWYCGLLELIIARLTGENYGKALEIAELPDSIRGYEHVKEKAAIAAKKRGQDLVKALRS